MSNTVWRWEAKIIRRVPALEALLLAVIFASGCGGGGGGGGSSAPHPLSAYTATTGVAQKGPLQQGSTVTAQELDPNLSPIGKQYTYQITSNLGTFSPTSTFGSQYIGLVATGYYYDEVANAVSGGPITLNSYSDLTTSPILNVNLLTTLAYQRIQMLVTKSGLSFAAARAQAEGEVLTALSIPARTPHGTFDSLDLTKGGDGDHILAAIASLFVFGNTAGNMSALVASFQSDLGMNGAITNPSTAAVLAASAKALNPASIAVNLTKEYKSLNLSFTASDISDWIDQDGDGLVGHYKFQVQDATPASSFAFPANLTDQSAGNSISVTGGQLAINGTPMNGAVSIKSGDVVSVSPSSGNFPNGVLTVYLMSGATKIGRVSFVSGLASIEVTPVATTLPLGLIESFVAIGTFTDTSTAPLSGNVAWVSSAPAIVAIDASSGRATATAIGSTTVTATSGSVSGSTSVVVGAATLQSIGITPTPLLTGVQITQRVTATGTYSDGSTADLTGNVTWTTDAASIATITGGMVTGVALGTTNINASAGLVSASIPAVVGTNMWGSAAEMPTGLYLNTTTLLNSGKVLVTGGKPVNTTSGQAVASVRLYDPATDQWTSGADMPTPRMEHVAVLLSDGRVLVMGGQTSNTSTTYLTSVILYDPIANAWSTAASMSLMPLIHSATLLPNGKVLFTGAAASSLPPVVAEIYDPVLNVWSSGGTPARSLYSPSAVLLPSGKVLLAGGLGGTVASFVPTAASQLYDPASNTWTAAPDMTQPHIGSTATLLGDGRVLIAGSGNYPQGTSNKVDIYSPTSNTWTAAASLITPRGGHSATLLPSGKVLVAGGMDEYLNPSLLNSAELYDPATDTWSPAASMAHARYLHSAVTLSSGIVLVVGGQFPAGADAASCEIYW